MPAYTVYVIQNPEARFYIEITDDLVGRLSQHNSDVFTWTRHRGPWKLVWYQPGLTLFEARKLELLLRRQKGGNGFFIFTGLPRPSP